MGRGIEYGVRPFLDDEAQALLVNRVGDLDGDVRREGREPKPEVGEQSVRPAHRHSVCHHGLLIYRESGVGRVELDFLSLDNDNQGCVRELVLVSVHRANRVRSSEAGNIYSAGRHAPRDCFAPNEFIAGVSGRDEDDKNQWY